MSGSSGRAAAPKVVVVLTDGYTPWPHDPVPGVAVVAGLLGRDPTLLPETPAWMLRVPCVLTA